METATLFNIGVANTSGRIHPALANTATESSPLFGQALAEVEANREWAGEEGEQIGPNALASVLDLLRATLVVENPTSQTPPPMDGDATAPQGGFVLPTSTSLKLASPAQIAVNAEVLAKFLGQQNPAAEKLRAILGLDRPAMNSGPMAFAGFELVDAAPQAPANAAGLAASENTPGHAPSAETMSSQGAKPEGRDLKIAGAVTALVLTFNGSREQLAQQMKMGVPFGGTLAAEVTPSSAVINSQVAAMTVTRGQANTGSVPTVQPKVDPTTTVTSGTTEPTQDLPKMGAPQHVIEAWEQQRGMRRPGDTLAGIRAAGLASDNSAPVNTEDAKRLVKAIEDVRDWVRQSSVTTDPATAAVQPKSAWTLKDALLVKGGLRDMSPVPSAPSADTVTGVDVLRLAAASNDDASVTAETTDSALAAKMQASAKAKADVDAQAPVTVARATSQDETKESMEKVLDRSAPTTLKVTEGKIGESANTQTVSLQAVVTPRSLDTVSDVVKAKPQMDMNATIREFANRVEEASLSRAARNFTMTLHPPDAGSIEVAVKAAGSRLNIEVTASDADVQTQLDRNRAEFVQSVEQKGMTVQTFNVNASQVNVNLGQNQQGAAQQQPNAQDFQQAANLNGTGQRREETVPQSVPSRLTTTQIDFTA